MSETNEDILTVEIDRLRADNAAKFDEYCRNLTELAQVHKESCNAKNARIAELKDDVVTLSYTATEKATALEAANARIAKLEADKVRWRQQLNDFEQDCKDERARAEKAEVELEEMDAVHLRAQRAEARIAELDSALLNHMDDWAEETIIALRKRIAELEADLLHGHESGPIRNMRTRAECAEAERDALLYNAESQYCAGMSAGFELGRNDDRAELSRIITQRWTEIADAKARAALNSSSTDEKLK